MCRPLRNVLTCQIVTDPGSGPQPPAVSATVWDHFREPTLKRVDVIEDAVIALLEGRLTPEQRRQAAREASKLAGSAATFGFPRSSQIAQEIEKRLSTESPGQQDAVFISEQLIAIRTDLACSPQALSSGTETIVGGSSTLLLLVVVDVSVGD